MTPPWLNTQRHPSWGLLPLATLAWHGWRTLTLAGPDPLLFICYSATLLLGLGICFRHALFATTGAGWLIVGFPLWLYDAAANNDWEASCVVFHAVGVAVGTTALASNRMPRHTWLFAVTVGIALHLVARLMTGEALNINAAFRVYRGWDEIFPSHTFFVAVSVLGFSAYFIALTSLSHWLADRRANS